MCNSDPDAVETQVILFQNEPNTDRDDYVKTLNDTIVFLITTNTNPNAITPCTAMTHEPGSRCQIQRSKLCDTLEPISTPITLVRTAFVEDFHVNTERSKYAGAVEQYQCHDLLNPVKISKLIPLTFDAAVTVLETCMKKQY